MVDSLVTPDTIEWINGWPYFMGSGWTPAGYALCNNHGQKYTLYNDYVTNYWYKGYHSWKDGVSYPEVCYNVLYTYGTGGIISRVSLSVSNPSIYILSDGRQDGYLLSMVDPRTMIRLPNNTPTSANSKLMIDRKYALVVNNKELIDCYDNKVNSKILFIDDYGMVFSKHIRTIYNMDLPPAVPKTGMTLIEEEPPKKVLYYAANLTELVEKYFPNALI
jgi:hypothetical protein